MREVGRGALAVGLVVAVGVLSACSSAAVSDDSSEPTTVTIERIGSAQTRSVAPRSSSPSTTTHRSVPVPAVARDFAWADGNALPDAYCLTVLRGLSPREALRVLAGNTVITGARQAVTDAGNLTDPGYDGSGHYYQSIVAGSRNGWTYVLEDNGYLATEDPATERLAQHGAALVMFENIEADSTIRYAKNGRLVREFDPLLYDTREGKPLPQERGLAFGTDDVGVYHRNALELTFARRMTGVTLTPSDFDPMGYEVGVVVRY